MGPAYLAIARVLLDRGEPEETDVWLGRLADVLEVAPEPHVLLAQSLVLADRRDAGGDTEGALGGLRATTVRLERWATPPRPLAEEALLRERPTSWPGRAIRAARALARRLGPASTTRGLVLAARLRLRLEEPVDGAALLEAASRRGIARMSGANPGEPGRQIIVEPLIERERTMLRYLASALSNVEIAAELSVSVSTVKTRRAVYRKLGAVGRRDAVRRARVLALL